MENRTTAAAESALTVTARSAYQTRAFELYDDEEVAGEFASFDINDRTRRLIQVEPGTSYAVLTGENAIGSIYVEAVADGKRWAAVLLPGSF